MRYLLLFLISLAFLSCGINKSRLTDLKKIGLIGKVQHLKLNHQLADETENSENKPLAYPNEGEGVFIDNEFFFNKKGMISEQRQYISNNLSKTIIYSYTKNFQLNSKEYYNSSGELVTKSNFEFFFNKKGELVKQMEFMASKSSLTDSAEIKYQAVPYETMEYLYDENGHFIQLNYIQSALGPSFKGVTEYKNGIIDKQSNMDLNGRVITSKQYKCLEFDHKNNCVKFLTLENNQPESYISAKLEYYK